MEQWDGLLAIRICNERQMRSWTWTTWTVKAIGHRHTFLCSGSIPFSSSIFIFKLLLGNGNAPMVLGGKMKMIDVSNSFILKKKKEEKVPFFLSLFIFFRPIVDARASVHLAEPSQETEIPEIEFGCVCSGTDDSPIAFISISSAAIKEGSIHTRAPINGPARCIQRRRTAVTFQRFNVSATSNRYLFYAQKS